MSKLPEDVSDILSQIYDQGIRDGHPISSSEGYDDYEKELTEIYSLTVRRQAVIDAFTNQMKTLKIQYDQIIKRTASIDKEVQIKCNIAQMFEFCDFVHKLGLITDPELWKYSSDIDKLFIKREKE